ncbi:hypothetical protein TNCV_3679051 [Trichonephila clavipes]|nr:hypothetical protein TNCV_3679051 [Trichonephila clavipes]
MEVNRVEQRACVKIAVLRRKDTMECHSELVEALGKNSLTYRTVAWRFATREDIANAVCQPVSRFTHDATNAEACGIQCFPHRSQSVVTVAGDYI